MTTAETRAKHTQRLEETNGEAAAVRTPRHATLLCLLVDSTKYVAPIGWLAPGGATRVSR
jgi:hypothetical protein